MRFAKKYITSVWTTFLTLSFSCYFFKFKILKQEEITKMWRKRFLPFDVPPLPAPLLQVLHLHWLIGETSWSLINALARLCTILPGIHLFAITTFEETVARPLIRHSRMLALATHLRAIELGSVCHLYMSRIHIRPSNSLCAPLRSIRYLRPFYGRTKHTWWYSNVRFADMIDCIQ